MKDYNNLLVITKAILAFNATIREQAKDIITSNVQEKECTFPPVLDAIVYLCHMEKSNIEAFAKQLEIKTGALQKYCQSIAPDLFPHTLQEAIANYFEYPENFCMEASKLHQKIPTRKLVTKRDEQKQETTVFLSRTNKELTMTISLHNATEYAGNFSEFDLIVENAIGCLYEAGSNEKGVLDISPQMIARYIKGLPRNATVSKKEVEAIDSSLRKLFSTLCKLRYSTDVMREWGISNVSTESMVVSGKHIEIKLKNGCSIAGWRILAPPVFYVHSKQIKQVIPIPCALLNTKSIFKRENQQITQLKFTLIAHVLRINNAKQKNNRQSTINVSKLCEKYYPTASRSREMQSRALETITKILDFFKEKNFIQDYTKITTQKGHCNSIEIIPKR